LSSIIAGSRDRDDVCERAREREMTRVIDKGGTLTVASTWKIEERDDIKKM